MRNFLKQVGKYFLKEESIVHVSDMTQAIMMYNTNLPYDRYKSDTELFE